MAGTWREDDHPRGGEGTKEGGKFVPKGGRGTPSEKDQGEPKSKKEKPSRLERAKALLSKIGQAIDKAEERGDWTRYKKLSDIHSKLKTAALMPIGGSEPEQESQKDRRTSDSAKRFRANPETETAVQNALDDGMIVGVRMIPEELPDVAIGDELAPSFDWREELSDRERGKNPLPGTSALGVRNVKHLQATINKATGYFGHQMVIVAGRRSDYQGDDPGEVVISDAKVISVILRV